MSQQRDASAAKKRSHTPGGYDAPTDRTGVAGDSATRNASEPPPWCGDHFDISSPEYREACRLFPGFELLPTALLASFDPYARFFRRDDGPLTLAERETVARAVTGRDEVRLGTPGRLPALDDERERLISAFCVKLVHRWSSVAEEVALMLEAGMSSRIVHSIAETAIVFRYAASLAAAMLCQPPARAVAARESSCPRCSVSTTA
ncbi:MAG: hypothetical protein AB1689_03930 [Thermodesulfobacteriota bacterium]